MVRCRLQHSEGAPGRALHSGNIGVCDIREAAVRERAASTAGNRPLFYFRFGERTPLRETPAGPEADLPPAAAVDTRCGQAPAGFLTQPRAGAGGVPGQPLPPTGLVRLTEGHAAPGSQSVSQPTHPDCPSASGPSSESFC